MASRAILAEARQTKKAKIRELREVEEVVGVATVERVSDNGSDSDSDHGNEVDISGDELPLEFNR